MDNTFYHATFLPIFSKLLHGIAFIGYLGLACLLFLVSQRGGDLDHQLVLITLFLAFLASISIYKRLHDYRNRKKNFFYFFIVIPRICYLLSMVVFLYSYFA